LKNSDNKKLNDGCLKIFAFLKLLYEDKAYYNDVIDIFKDEAEEQSTNLIQVNLNKYINTLKIFGIKMKKENGKFKLLSSLYSMNFTLDDLKSISILSSSIKNHPDEDIKKEISEVLRNIEFRMNSEDKNTLNIIQSNSPYDFSFYYADIRDQIKQCQQLCKENFLINLTYIQSGEEIRSICTPKEVLYDSKTAYLRVYDSKLKQHLEIPMENIISIEKMPQIANNIEMSQTVVYKLKGKLAKTYKVKENEYSNGTDDEGNLIIVNKNEPFNNLIKRLMRYTYSCEVVSPKTVREMMIEAINKTIKNYGIEEEIA